MASWSSITQTSEYVPPSLRSLIPLDQLLVEMKIDPVEKAYFKIQNKEGVKVYDGIEAYDSRYTNSEKFSSIYILENYGYDSEVIHLRRRTAFSRINRFFCVPRDPQLQTLKVYSPPGKLIAHVEQIKCSSPASKLIFYIKNENKVLALALEALIECDGESVKLEISSAYRDSVGVGEIKKQRSSTTTQELLPVQCEISFRLNLDVRMKAALLSTCILIMNIL